jgi:hypothetical protein
MTTEPINLEQTENNDLTKVGQAERSKLFPKNDYKKDSNQYSATNRNALADGDDKGKGTGVFLDVYNQSAGANFDVIERKSAEKINKFKPSNTYPNF